MEPPDISQFDKNRAEFPLDELAKYAGKHVAFSPDGTRILASGESMDDVCRKLEVLGIHFSQVVHEYLEEIY
jgi:hypothetical protein